MTMVAPLAPDDPTTLGAFRLTGRLGEGGQGVVYLGRASDGDSVASVLHKIMTADPDVAGVPDPLRATVRRCLAKDPAVRPTARDLLLGLVGSAPDPLVAGAAAADGAGPGSGQNAQHGRAAQPWQHAGAPMAHPASAPVRQPGGPGPQTRTGHPAEPPVTEPANARRRSRTGLIAGLVVLAAVAALLVPRILSSSGSVTPRTSPDTTAAAETPDSGPAVTEGGTDGDSGSGPDGGSGGGTGSDGGSGDQGNGTGKTVPAAFEGT
jgi:hypothetical protein